MYCFLCSKRVVRQNRSSPEGWNYKSFMRWAQIESILHLIFCQQSIKNILYIHKDCNTNYSFEIYCLYRQDPGMNKRPLMWPWPCSCCSVRADFWNVIPDPASDPGVAKVDCTNACLGGNFPNYSALWSINTHIHSERRAGCRAHAISKEC